MTVVTDRIPFPLVRPTREEADMAFRSLVEWNHANLCTNAAWSTRAVVSFDRMPSIIGGDTTGMAASNHFAFAARMCCDALASPSPVRSWFDPKIRRSLEGSAFWPSNPRAALAMRKYIAAQFRPTAAKWAASILGARRIYDPCAGWGDRLIGWLATPEVASITVRDVSPLSILACHEIVAAYSGGTDVRILLSPAESGPTGSAYDLVMTSPPYYKLEKYAGEDSSWRRYKGFDAWLDGFLRPMITTAWSELTVGGWFVLNVGDAYADHRWNRIVQPAWETLMSCPGAEFVTCVGYRMPTRVNARNQFTGVFAEPMLLFRRGT
jgi:hypothetical protein